MENKQTAFDLCGVKFLQRVSTPYGVGVVQGILKERTGDLKVIVAHRPDVLPVEMVPGPCMWKLMYYEPTQVAPVV